MRSRNGNFPEAADIYARGCALFSMHACTGYARALMRGEGRAMNEVEGANLYERMCLLGDDHACEQLANAIFAGKGRPRDSSAADAFLRRACDAKNAIACQLLRMPLRFTDIELARRKAIDVLMPCMFHRDQTGNDCTGEPDAG